jgi:hypothetical protein
MTNAENPWSDVIVVAQIPEHGLHRDIEAGLAARGAMAALAGLREVSSARASFDVTPMHDGRVHVVGTVSARVGQTCVVTLDPVDNAIDETIDVIFAPAPQVEELSAKVDNGEDDTEIPDPPEPIEDGKIDLGRLATDVLFLGIDPYPRKPGAVFEAPVVPPDPQDHPFAALKALMADDGQPAPKKPKRD